MLAALPLSASALTALAATPRPAFAYNCVDAVLRDTYWGQFPGVIRSGGLAAGIADAFARAGFRVDGTASEGAIMSWPPGAYGASTAGHVGLVDAVHEDGTVLVRHENWNGRPEQTHRMAVRPGHRFVHRLEPAPPPPAPPQEEI